MSNYLHENRHGTLLLLRCNGIFHEGHVRLSGHIHAGSGGADVPYDDRYTIHTFDGLRGFDSFSSARKAMMDGDRKIIQYYYVTYICQELDNTAKCLEP